MLALSVGDHQNRALNQGKSLLAAGVVKIEGTFVKGENILILDSNQKSLARGLSSFSSSEINKIKGKQSREIENNIYDR